MKLYTVDYMYRQVEKGVLVGPIETGYAFIHGNSEEEAIERHKEIWSLHTEFRGSDVLLSSSCRYQS